MQAELTLKFVPETLACTTTCSAAVGRSDDAVGGSGARGLHLPGERACGVVAHAQQETRFAELGHDEVPVPRRVGRLPLGGIQQRQFIAEVHDALQGGNDFTDCIQHTAGQGRRYGFSLQSSLTFEKLFFCFVDALGDVVGRQLGGDQKLPQLFLHQFFAHC